MIGRGKGQDFAAPDEEKLVMKKLMMCVLIALMAATAGAQSLGTTISKKQQQRKLAPPPPVSKQQVEGVVPRAFQSGGNPLQMINPYANSAKYGTADQHVVIDPETGKWKGIKLFSFIF